MKSADNFFDKHRVGWSYITGSGVRGKNYEQAERWLKSAKKEGYQDATWALEMLHRTQLKQTGKSQVDSW